MGILWIVLLCLSLLAVAAQLAFNAFLVRMARRGKSGTEIIAVAFVPASLVVDLVAAPGGAWLAFHLAAGAPSAPVRFGYRVAGSLLAAKVAAFVLGFARQVVSRRRDRRGAERVMTRTETLGLIESGVIASLCRSADGAVTVGYVDNRWAGGVYDHRRSGFADPAGWPDYEAAHSRTPGAKSFAGTLLYRPDHASRGFWEMLG